MNLRFLTGSDRPALDQRMPEGSAVPRTGETVALRDPDSGEVLRWSVKTVLWDYSTGEPTVDVHVAMSVPSRVPSFAAYTD